eukprot:8618206-Heterocapsa_arctica.AAC.1
MRLEKEALAQAKLEAASSEEDIYEFSETGPWRTDMTTEQDCTIRAWTKTFRMGDPAYMVRMEDDTILKMAETDNTEPEKQ